MTDLNRPQHGRYQPRKGYGLRLRDVRDHDGEFGAAFLSAMLLACAGYGARQLGVDPLAMAFGTVAIWVLVGLTAWTMGQFVRGFERWQ